MLHLITNVKVSFSHFPAARFEYSPEYTVSPLHILAHYFTIIGRSCTQNGTLKCTCFNSYNISMLKKKFLKINTQPNITKKKLWSYELFIVITVTVLLLNVKTLWSCSLSLVSHIHLFIMWGGRQPNVEILNSFY